MLEQYPNDVVVYVTDPRTGVQRASKFPPTIAEIVAACDSRMAHIHQQKRFENWGKNEPEMIEPPRQDRPSIEDLKAKYGPNWGMTSLDAPAKPPKPAPTKEELAEHYRTHGLAFKPKQEAEE